MIPILIPITTTTPSPVISELKSAKELEADEEEEEEQYIYTLGIHNFLVSGKRRRDKP